MEFENSDGLEDITHLLYLETLKRFHEEESNINQQVEEKFQQYKEIQTEYLNVYETYAKLLELCATRAFLVNKNNCINDSHVKKTSENINFIKESIGKVVDFIEPEQLELTKKLLAEPSDFQNLEKLSAYSENNQKLVNEIQSTLERVELKTERGIIEGLDYFVKQLPIVDPEDSEGENEDDQEEDGSGETVVLAEQ